MRHEDKIKEVAGKGIPFRVPENYFESFKSDLMNNLPDYPEKSVQPKLSLWQRVRPYVYLAAMFAGIWCMMQIFHRAGGTDTISKSNFDSELAMLSIEPDSYDYYLGSDEGFDFELQDEVAAQYSNIDDFKRDFYAASID